MWPFKFSAEMFAAGPEAVISISARDKLAVQKAVQNGINTGLVKPIQSHLFDRVEDIDLA